MRGVRGALQPLTKITKIEAARNQLQTAIDIWFSEGDQVSICTLAYASHEIIHRIYRLEGHTDLMFDSVNIKDEHRDDFAKFIKAAPNFFKHANNETDQDDEIEFSTGLSELLILASIVGLIRMSKILNNSESAFMYWQRIHHPSWFSSNGVGGEMPIDIRDKLAEIGRPMFYKAFIHQKEKGLITPEFTAS